MAPRISYVKNMALKLYGIGIQIEGSEHDLEDRYLCDWQLCSAAVADGVSRPRYDRGESETVGRVAEAFCKTAIQLVSEFPNSLNVVMPTIAREANQRIAELNRKHGYSAEKDYSERDPFATVAACVAMDSSGMLHFGYIGDVGIAVFGADRQFTRVTRDQVAEARHILRARVFDSGEARLNYMRTMLRNQRRFAAGSDYPAGYGVLNGDPRATDYWETGSIQLRRKEFVALYTDGARGIVEGSSFHSFLTELYSRETLSRDSATIAKSFCELASAQQRQIWDDMTIVLGQVN